MDEGGQEARVSLSRRQGICEVLGAEIEARSAVGAHGGLTAPKGAYKGGRPTKSGQDNMRIAATAILASGTISALPGAFRPCLLAAQGTTENLGRPARSLDAAAQRVKRFGPRSTAS
ncbi:hypothetical protein B0A55_08831 [Friedmanniomyces simplex]|uniref:Uncharacterized protein n=1 Tax=Friedmanniomyces simplex TaxID=329884 RepID=A0A4U0X4E6_9PEZI|nr:hypothetical protein B0A55_08831 [Friedmanniomyces simplex]